ncbi:unnamed protein product, partial [marine sediment metagenome]
MNVIERINMLKKMVKEAEKIVAWQETIYTALHNIHADWIVSGVLALARIPHHHTTHEPGGADEVTGVAPGAHAGSHQNGGADEVNVGGLSGELADNQPPKAHKDTHDPIDGSDKLDTAVPVKVGAANAIGSSHSLARADHVHEREHAKTTAGELNLADMADITLYEGANELNIGLTPIPPPVANLYGKVTDAETGYPLSGVKVTIDGLVTYTDASGNYG